MGGELTANRHEGILWGDGNVLKLDWGNGYQVYQLSKNY